MEISPTTLARVNTVLNVWASMYLKYHMEKWVCEFMLIIIIDTEPDTVDNIE